MSDQIQQLVINFGTLVVVSLPIIAIIFKWNSDKVSEAQKHIAAVAGALAVLAASMFAVWHANTTAVAVEKNKIEAVKALSTVPAEHKEERARFLGVRPG